jgi:hypothetical protein
MLMKPRLQAREPRSQLHARVFSGLYAIARHSALLFSARGTRVRTTTNFLRTEKAAVIRFESFARIPAFQKV